ncbi:hypothetical protein D3C73_1510870 [compost metagenome]
MAGNVLPNNRLNAEFFVQFTPQRLRLALAGLYLTAGKLPHTRLIRMRRALSE